jgi:hypothetical protein
MGTKASAAIVVVAVLGALLGAALLVGARLSESAPLPTSRLGNLAYALDGDIFLADGDGRNPVRIADGLPGGKAGCGSAGYWAEGPMWSPDGQYLAYRSPRSQERCDRPEADTFPTIRISDSAGDVVAEFPGVGWLIPWSSDSTRVATWLDLYPSTKIGVYGVDGVRQAVLSLPPSLYGTMNGDYDPVWSPDGDSILILVAMSLDANVISNVVWEVPIDGSPPRLLPADDPRSHWLSARSPDGLRVAYVVESRDGSGSGTLVAAAADGSQPRDLFTVYTGDPLNRLVWSPTGDRIAFAGGVRFEKDGARVEDPTAVRVVDVASGSATLVAAGIDEGSRVLAFSPEGDRIMFSRDDADGQAWSLWSVDADGSDPRLLVSRTEAADWQPVRADPSSGDTGPPSSSLDSP